MEKQDFVLKDSYKFAELVEICRYLRSEHGGAWEKAQSHRSLVKNLVEEAYEVVDAIEQANPSALQDELSDLLFQVLFHAEFARQDGNFTIEDVITSLARKLIARSPHVFANTEAQTVEEALHSWQQSKYQQKGFDTLAKVLADVPKTLPAALRAEKVQEKAASWGFDWQGDLTPVWQKVQEEAEELKEAYAQQKQYQPKECQIQPGFSQLDSYQQAVLDEAGDLLFITINLLRKMNISAEIALNHASEKFINRLALAEKMAMADGTGFKQLSDTELENYYQRAKEELKHETR